MPIARVHWHAPSGDSAGGFSVSCRSEFRDFTSYSDAMAWATARSGRLSAHIEGLGEWDAEPTANDRRNIEAFIQRAQDRFAREQRSYPEPVEWFVAFLEPDVDDRDALANAANGQPEITSAHVHHQTHRGEREHWLLVTVLAHSQDAATSAANDALFRLVWPPERRPKGPWMVSIGRHQVCGLAEFARDEFA
jgi:hypothetical protein